MAVPSPSPSKSELRTDALRRRREFARSLAPETRDALQDRLARLLLPRLNESRLIAAYHPLADEISPYPLLERLGSGRRIAFPWFADRDARMIWREGPAVEAGPWGMLQPAAAAPSLSPDTLIVPLVLADRRGTRIGHGKGHYDRALARLREAGPVFAIGLAWEEQVSEAPLPADPWDAPLDAVATPKEWIACR